ncbi:hypothetical protein [Actinomadura chokoriensis]|uniref:hypothetical protein n=1 Tax=Actinomadura chokoriensis TaxID=454156 RepID=UPI0031F9BA7C
MLRAARGVLYAIVPGELVVFVLLISGVALPRPVVIAGESAVLAALLLEIVVAGRLVREARRDGAGWWAAFRDVERLLPEPVRRIVSFDTKGLVSLVLFVTRRRNGVPPDAVGVAYSGGQLSLQLSFLFAMVVETAAVEMLLRGIDAPDALRMVILVVDLYSILIVLAVIAACVTRPHVLSDEELRIRYGAFFDLRVPRDRIASMRVARNFNETGMVRIVDGRLSVAVASQTNVVVELHEPVTVVRPLGKRAEARTLHFFADDPKLLVPEGTRNR